MPRGALSGATHPQQEEVGRHPEAGGTGFPMEGPEPASDYQRARQAATPSAMSTAMPGQYHDSQHRGDQMQGALSLSPSPSISLSLSPSPSTSTSSPSTTHHRHTGRAPLQKHRSELLDRTQRGTPYDPDSPGMPHGSQGMSPDWIKSRPKTRGKGRVAGLAPRCPGGMPPVPPARGLHRTQTLHPAVLRAGDEGEARQLQEGSRDDSGGGGGAAGAGGAGGHPSHSIEEGQQGLSPVEREGGASHDEAATGPEEPPPPLQRTQCMARGSQQPLAPLPLRLDSDEDGEDGGVLLADPLGSPLSLSSSALHMDSGPGPALSPGASWRAKLGSFPPSQSCSAAEIPSGLSPQWDETFCLGQRSPRPVRHNSLVPKGFASPGHAAGGPGLGPLRHCSSDAATSAGHATGSPGGPSPPRPSVPSPPRPSVPSPGQARMPHAGVAGASFHGSTLGQPRSEGSPLRPHGVSAYRATRMGPSPGSPGLGPGGSKLPANPPSSGEIAARIAWHMARGSPGGSPGGTPGMSPSASPLRQSSLGPHRSDGYASSSPSGHRSSLHSQSLSHSGRHSTDYSQSQVTGLSHGAGASHKSSSRSRHGASASFERPLGPDAGGSYHSDMDGGSRLRARYAHGSPGPSALAQGESSLSLGSSCSGSPHSQKKGHMRRDALGCAEGILSNPYVSQLRGSGLQTQLSGSFGYSTDQGYGGGGSGGRGSSGSRLQKARAKTEPSEREAHAHAHNHQELQPHSGLASACGPAASAAAGGATGGIPGAPGRFPKSASESQARGAPAADPPSSTPLPCDSYNLTDLHLSDAEVLAKGGAEILAEGGAAFLSSEAGTDALGMGARQASLSESSLGSSSSIGGGQDPMVEIFFFCGPPPPSSSAAAAASPGAQGPGPGGKAGAASKEGGAKKNGLKSALKTSASALQPAPSSLPSSSPAPGSKAAHGTSRKHGAHSTRTHGTPGTSLLSKWAAAKQPTQPAAAPAAAGSGGSGGGSSQWSSPALSPLLSPETGSQLSFFSSQLSVSSSQLSTSSSGSLWSPQFISPIRSPEVGSSARSASGSGAGLASGSGSGPSIGLGSERSTGSGSGHGRGSGPGSAAEGRSRRTLQHTLSPNLLSSRLSSSVGAAPSYAALPRAGRAPAGAGHASHSDAAAGADVACGSDQGSGRLRMGASPEPCALPALAASSSEEGEGANITASGTCSKKASEGRADPKRGSERHRRAPAQSTDPIARADSTSREPEPGGSASRAKHTPRGAAPFSSARPPASTSGESSSQQSTPSGTPWGSPNSSPLARRRPLGTKPISRKGPLRDTPGAPDSSAVVASPLSRVSAIVAALPQSYRQTQGEPRGRRHQGAGQGHGHDQGQSHGQGLGQVQSTAQQPVRQGQGESQDHILVECAELSEGGGYGEGVGQEPRGPEESGASGAGYRMTSVHKPGGSGALEGVEGSLEEDVQRTGKLRASHRTAAGTQLDPNNQSHTSGHAPSHAHGHRHSAAESCHAQPPSHATDSSTAPLHTRGPLVLGRTISPIPARLLVSTQSGDPSFRKSCSLSAPDPAQGEAVGSPPLKAKSILISGQSRLPRVQSLGTGRRVTFCDNVQEL